MKIFLVSLFRLLGFVITYSFIQRVMHIKWNLYTYWISKEFKSVGQYTIIKYPLELRGGKYITIGNHVNIGKQVILTAWDNYKSNSTQFKPEIIIGDSTVIGDYTHITSIERIQIGNNVLMGRYILITDNSHGTFDNVQLRMRPIDRPLFTKGPVIIGDGVWIGDKVTILSGVRIGENAIIGANSLVTKDVPMNCIFGGVPAHLIKKL